MGINTIINPRYNQHGNKLRTAQILYIVMNIQINDINPGQSSPEIIYSQTRIQILFNIILFFLFTAINTNGQAIDRLNLKSLADTLEQIPIGTSMSKITNDYPQLRLKKSLLVQIRDHTTLLAFNPMEEGVKNTLALYRQYPLGVLLKVTDDDQKIAFFQWALAGESIGALDIFFTKDMEYKGYWTYSTSGWSSDDKKRLLSELKSFVDLGMEDLARREYAKHYGSR